LSDIGSHQGNAVASLFLAVAIGACSASPDPALPPQGGPGGAGAISGTGGSGGTGAVPFGGSAGSGGIAIDIDAGGLGGTTSACGVKDVSALFVIDRSGSMKCNLPPATPSLDCERTPERADPAQPSKWEIVTDVLSTSFDQLVPRTPGLTVRAGLSFFSVDDECGARSQPSIPIADMTMTQLDLLRQSLSITPAGGTPIVGATILAYKHVYQPTFTGEGHVILLTDGADSCKAAYDVSVGPADHIAGLIDVEAPKALRLGIKTWVIGAPGSEPARHMLSNLARAGGTAKKDCDPGTDADPMSGNCHYDMTEGDFQVALAEAVKQIVTVVTCQVPQ
jgi:hypothetical protein